MPILAERAKKTESGTNIDGALGNKADKATNLTGATKTKITYNSQGIVTAGTDLDASDIPTSLPAVTAGIAPRQFPYRIGTTTIGGRTYNTVIIGNQEWLSENLQYNDGGTGIASATSGKFVGQIYYQKTAMTRINAALTDGWHVPSQAEYDMLRNHIGINISGTLLKSTSLWGNSKNGKNYYGFNVLPCGHLNPNASNHNVEWNAYLWTSTSSNNNYFVFWFTTEHDGTSTTWITDVDYYNSIRLVRNISSNITDLPAVGSTSQPVYVGVDGSIKECGFKGPSGDGTSGQYLKSNGSGNAPSWDDTSNFVSGETRRLFGVRKSLTSNTYTALLKVTALDSADYAYSGAIFSFTSRTNNKQNVKGFVTVSAYEWNEPSTIVGRTILLDSKVITNDESIPQFYVRQTEANNKWAYELWVKVSTTGCVISVNVVNDSRNFLSTMSDTSSTAPERLTECDLYSNVRAKCTSNKKNGSNVGSSNNPVYVDTDGSVKACDASLPSSNGTATYFLRSTGQSTEPEWTNPYDILYYMLNSTYSSSRAVNFNDSTFMSTGIYLLNANDSSTNGPAVLGKITLIVLRHSSDKIDQFAIGGGTAIYHRLYTSSWGRWLTIGQS